LGEKMFIHAQALIDDIRFRIAEDGSDFDECPMCNNMTMDSISINNALSRYFKGMHICNLCGNAEAREDSRIYEIGSGSV